MKLLTEKELVWSSVVANSTMNRERNASGINSYEKELKFKPEEFLRKHIELTGQAKWLDLCCGQGKALIQSAIYLADNNLQHRAIIKGIDLVDAFSSVPPEVTSLIFEVRPLANWVEDDKFDFITCIHGLHYIGNKLQVIQTALAALSEHGIFMANLDLTNISLKGADAGAYLKKKFKQNDIHYNGRSRIISCKGARNMSFDLIYEGASDKVGPNYTGQAAVTSFYTQS